MFNTSLRRHRLLREGAWVVGGQILSAAATLSGTRFITEYINPSTFGSVSLVLGATVLARSLLCGPTLYAVSRFYHQAQTAGSLPQLRRVSRGMIWTGTGIICVVLLMSGGIAGIARSAVDTPITFRGSDLWVALASTGAFPFIVLTALFIADSFRAFEMTLIAVARRQAVGAVLRTADSITRPLFVVITVMIAGASVVSYLMGQLISALLSVGALILFIRREGTTERTALAVSKFPNLTPDVSDRILRKQMLRYAAPLAPLAVIGWVNGVSDRYIIAGLVDVAATGVYAAAYGLMSQPFLMLAGVIDLTLTPSYYAAVTRKDIKKERQILFAWLAAVFSGSLLGCLSVYLVGEWLVKVLLAIEYRGATKFILWLAVGNAFQVMSQVFLKVCYAHKRTSLVPAVEGLGAVACIISVLVLVKTYGVMGAAYATPIYFGAQLAASIVVAWAILVPRKAGTPA